ncbi:MAG: hypothetical protein RLZZ584_4280, partial [Pseudomonadota bacterium]
MSRRLVTLPATCVLVGLVALAGWSARDHIAGVAASSATLHKCVGPGGLLYTDGPCPAGTRAASAGTAGGGSLSVVPAYQAPPTAAAAAASDAGLRELLLPSGGV